MRDGEWKGGSEGRYYKLREEWAEGGREGGRVFQREGGRGDRGRLLQREGGREGGMEGGREREGGYYKEREGGMEDITRVV